MKPHIVMTMGDPAGIGPEILVKAMAKPGILKQANFTIIGQLGMIEHVQKKILKNQKYQIPFNRHPSIHLIDFPLTQKKIQFGKATAENGYLSGMFIQAAIDMMKKGIGHSMVTNPINKVSFNLGKWGKKYRGHTEMLAELTHSKDVAMMLAYQHLRAVFVTSHIPLKKVPSFLTSRRIRSVILLADRELRKIGIKSPKLAVCGLNPHAGDGGLMGYEEKDIIQPAVRYAQKKGVRVQGPLPSDTLWPLVWNKKFDAGIAMYHDQGQIPIKLLGFGQIFGRQNEVHGINMTLGLPFPRFSVGHGTAYEIAGTGVASETSLVDAIQMAAQVKS